MSTTIHMTAGRDNGRRCLSAVADAGPRDAAAERDVLADLAGEIESGIAALPASSPWRAWLARVTRILRARAGLPLLRTVEGGES